jgi:hypothetical protein
MLAVDTSQPFLFAALAGNRAPATVEKCPAYRVTIAHRPDSNGDRWRAALDLLIAAGLEAA